MRLIRTPMKFYNGLLGRDWTLESLEYPIIATSKFQGVFVMRDDDELWTRKGDGVRKVDNVTIREYGLAVLKNGMNAELCVDGWAERQVAGLLHAKDGREVPHVVFYVFDWMQGNPNFRYISRMEEVTKYLPCILHYCSAETVNLRLCSGPNDVLDFHKTCITRGWEGVVLRKPDGAYKFGRSTLKEATAFKIIGVETRVATISDFTPNTAKSECVGAIKAVDEKYGDIFIGSGFSIDESHSFYNFATRFIGRKIYYQHRPHGMKDKPRQPIFAGFV